MHLHGASSSGVPGWQKEAWAFASWLEYVGIWRGQATADYAALSAITALKCMARVGKLGGRWTRVRRKTDQVDEIVEFVTTLEHRLPLGDTGYYPHAVKALAKTLRNSTL